MTTTPEDPMATPTGSPVAIQGEFRTPGIQTCGYKPTGAPEDCGQPATWHVLWDGTLNHGLTCNEHMNLIQQRLVYADRHPITADCVMPGALWVFLSGRCEVPTDEPALAVARQINTGGTS